jgi:hypothetical protein
MCSAAGRFSSLTTRQCCAQTGVVIISLMYRASPKTPYRISWDGIALAGMYIGAIAALYWLG